MTVVYLICRDLSSPLTKQSETIPRFHATLHAHHTLELHNVYLAQRRSRSLPTNRHTSRTSPMPRLSILPRREQGPSRYELDDQLQLASGRHVPVYGRC